jgi:hypothetical protein
VYVSRFCCGAQKRLLAEPHFVDRANFTACYAVDGRCVYEREAIGGGHWVLVTRRLLKLKLKPARSSVDKDFSEIEYEVDHFGFSSISCGRNGILCVERNGRHGYRLSFSPYEDVPSETLAIGPTIGTVACQAENPEFEKLLTEWPEGEGPLDA